MPHDMPSQAYTMFSYHRTIARSIRNFGTVLEPRYIFGANSLDQ